MVNETTMGISFDTRTKLLMFKLTHNLKTVDKTINYLIEHCKELEEDGTRKSGIK